MIAAEVGPYQATQGFAAAVGDFATGGTVDDGAVQVFSEQTANRFCSAGSDIALGGGIDQRGIGVETDQAAGLEQRPTTRLPLALTLARLPAWLWPIRPPR